MIAESEALTMAAVDRRHTIGSLSAELHVNTKFMKRLFEKHCRRYKSGIRLNYEEVVLLKSLIRKYRNLKESSAVNKTMAIIDSISEHVPGFVEMTDSKFIALQSDIDFHLQELIEECEEIF